MAQKKPFSLKDVDLIHHGAAAWAAFSAGHAQ